MKISVFGIGYVGAVTSACLAESGHSVIAIDTDAAKVRCINEGRSPIIEKDLDSLLQKNINNGRLCASTDGRYAVLNSEISLVCVGTPSDATGALDYKYIKDVCGEIGAVLREKDDIHTVVIRSTVIPGTLENIVTPALERASGKRAGKDFYIGNNPEFLRESTAIADYFNPTQIVVGAPDEETGARIMALYEGLEAPRTITDVTAAEGVKYVSNAWRAHKISFANEMGNILKQHGVDSHKVMDIFFQDTKINMGPSFLKPGFAFGGSCLPKDLRALRASASGKGLETPLLDAVIAANNLQIRRAFDMILASGNRNVALLGLSFKPNTDDLRESPLVTLADLLIREGYKLKIYDPCVGKARKIDGANRDYIEKGIAHITQCLVETPEELVIGSQTFVLGNGTREFADILGKTGEDVKIVDLVRLSITNDNSPYDKRASYAGICW